LGLPADQGKSKVKEIGLGLLQRKPGYGPQTRNLRAGRQGRWELRFETRAALITRARTGHEKGVAKEYLLNKNSSRRLAAAFVSAKTTKSREGRGFLTNKERFSGKKKNSVLRRGGRKKVPGGSDGLRKQPRKIEMEGASLPPMAGHANRKRKSDAGAGGGDTGPLVSSTHT